MNSITKPLEAGLCELWHSSYSLQVQIPQLRTYLSIYVHILYTIGQNVQCPTRGSRLEASSSVCYYVQRIHYILVLKVHACTHTVCTTQHKHESKDCMICSLSALQRVLLLHVGSASIAASAVGTKETYDTKTSLHTHHTRVHAHWGVEGGGIQNTDLLSENALSTKQVLMSHSVLKFHLWKYFYSAHTQQQQQQSTVSTANKHTKHT